MSFTVTLQPSGRQFQVARDEPVLAAAIRDGVGLPYGCRDGACGSCKCRLLEGRVIHGAHQLKALSAQEEEAGWMLSCCATPQTDLVVEARSVPGAGEFPVQKLPVRVKSLERPSPDVAIVTLQLPATARFEHRPGQYIEFILRDGSRRAYSMATAPAAGGASAENGLELHIRHMPGGKFTDQVFSTLKEKDILRLEGPFGSFFLRESRKPVVLLASGTGFAPIQALVQQMRAQGLDRPATLYWGGRRPQDLYRDAWVREQAAQLPWLRYVPVVSDARPEDAWTGRTGFVHEAVLADLPDLSGHEVYACGAPVMVSAAQRDFMLHGGLPDEAFFADSFLSEADKAGA